MSCYCCTRQIAKTLGEMGLGDETMAVRMTGCPNGCARPYMAELAFVGDGASSYQVRICDSVLLGCKARSDLSS
jgi:sulfite reductase beta subunit-like hemoprotein